MVRTTLLILSLLVCVYSHVIVFRSSLSFIISFYFGKHIIASKASLLDELAGAMFWYIYICIHG